MRPPRSCGRADAVFDAEIFSGFIRAAVQGANLSAIGRWSRMWPLLPSAALSKA